MREINGLHATSQTDVMGNLQSLVQKYISCFVSDTFKMRPTMWTFIRQKLNSDLYKIKLNQILTPEVKLVEK